MHEICNVTGTRLRGSNSSFSDISPPSSSSADSVGSASLSKLSVPKLRKLHLLKTFENVLGTIQFEDSMETFTRNDAHIINSPTIFGLCVGF